MKIRVVLADDHPALLAGVQHELDKVPSIEIVGTATESGELGSLLCQPVDVLVMDYAMPGGSLGDGIGLVAYLRRTYPGLKIIVFTMLDNQAIFQELEKLGVSSVLSKTHATTYLISAIHAVFAGTTYFRPALSSHRCAEPAPHPPRTKALSKRELEVIRLYASGMSVNEIGQQLHRTKQTISTQKTSAMRKLGLTRDADLFRYVFEIGMVSPSETSAASDGATVTDHSPSGTVDPPPDHR